MDIDEPIDLTAFSGKLPLFPLPGVVHFPHVVLPLHVFEERYRTMIEDALAGERYVGVVLLKPGFEADYEGSPAIHEMACLGKVVEERRLADGRFNILLLGVKRARVLREVSQVPYRVAEVELVEDDFETDPSLETEKRQQLQAAAGRFFRESPSALEKVEGLFRLSLSLGTLADVIAAAAPLDPQGKQGLLEEADALARATRLIGFLGAPDRWPTHWKPSDN